MSTDEQQAVSYSAFFAPSAYTCPVEDSSLPLVVLPTVLLVAVVDVF